MAVLKEIDYFDKFVVSVDFNCKISKRLITFIENFFSSKDIEKEVTSLHELEHEADKHFHEIYRHLNKSFITPIEREDILELAQAIDDVTDSIEEVAYALFYLNIKEIRGEILEFARLIEKSCEALRTALLEFKKFKKSKVLSENINKVNELEVDGDRLYHRMLRDLFRDNSDALNILKWREVYEKLEGCLDACENVADILEGIVLKNS